MHPSADKTLILTRSDVEAVLTVRDAMPVVEEAFRLYGLGQATMPPKVYLDIPSHQGDFRAMPAYLHGDWEAAGLKWVNVHPHNLGGPLPTVMAVLIYSDPQTGFPLAILDATSITRVRTGAAGGIAAKYLARPDSRSVALVGCGAQADHQLLAVAQVRPIERVFAFDTRPEAAQALRTRMLGRFAVEVADSIQACVAEADIVVTTTPVHEPIVKARWLRPGAHLNAIGADAPGKQEYETEVLKKALVFVDDWAQSSHSGEINVPFSQGLFHEQDVCATLGEVVAGLKPGRQSDADITLFDSTGLAIQDIATARYVYNLCRERNIGMPMRFV